MQKFMALALVSGVIMFVAPEVMAGYVVPAKSDTSVSGYSQEFVSETTNVAAHPKRRQSPTKSKQKYYEPVITGNNIIAAHPKHRSSGPRK